MRKGLIIALGLASLAAVVGTDPASARVTCEQKCTQRVAVPNSYAKCVQIRTVCTGSNNQGPGAPRTIQEQKTKGTK